MKKSFLIFITLFAALSMSVGCACKKCRSGNNGANNGVSRGNNNDNIGHDNVLTPPPELAADPGNLDNGENGIDNLVDNENGNEGGDVPPAGPEKPPGNPPGSGIAGSVQPAPARPGRRPTFFESLTKAETKEPAPTRRAVLGEFPKPR